MLKNPSPQCILLLLDLEWPIFDINLSLFKKSICSCTSANFSILQGRSDSVFKKCIPTGTIFLGLLKI
jgi:hypothetical protein